MHVALIIIDNCIFIVLIRDSIQRLGYVFVLSLKTANYLLLNLNICLKSSNCHLSDQLRKFFKLIVINHTNN